MLQEREEQGILLQDLGVFNGFVQWLEGGHLAGVLREATKGLERGYCSSKNECKNCALIQNMYTFERYFLIGLTSRGREGIGLTRAALSKKRGVSAAEKEILGCGW